MIGNNVLEFNQATMIAAMQYYLDNVIMKDAGKARVVSVQSKNVNYATEFEILTTDEVKA